MIYAPPRAERLRGPAAEPIETSSRHSSDTYRHLGPVIENRVLVLAPQVYIMASEEGSGSKKFEPKTPVQLDPPKDDPITVEELAKCDGEWLLADKDAPKSRSRPMHLSLRICVVCMDRYIC
jgi:hypothetical protein